MVEKRTIRTNYKVTENIFQKFTRLRKHIIGISYLSNFLNQKFKYLHSHPSLMRVSFRNDEDIVGVFSHIYFRFCQAS